MHPIVALLASMYTFEILSNETDQMPSSTGNAWGSTFRIRNMEPTMVKEIDVMPANVMARIMRSCDSLVIGPMMYFSRKSNISIPPSYR